MPCGDPTIRLTKAIVEAMAHAPPCSCFDQGEAGLAALCHGEKNLFSGMHLAGVPLSEFRCLINKEYVCRGCRTYFMQIVDDRIFG